MLEDTGTDIKVQMTCHVQILMHFMLSACSQLTLCNYPGIVGGCTVKPVLKDHPTGHKNMVSQDRWSLVRGSFTLKCRIFCPKLVVLQDRWSLIAVVSLDRFHCISIQYNAYLYTFLVVQ